MNEKKFIITRSQFEKLSEVFQQQGIDQVIWREHSDNGIGPVIKLEYVCTQDITDLNSW